jgi:hypothetical protein
MNLALVFAKLRGGQAVIGGHGLLSAKERGDGECPSAIGASPAAGFALDSNQRAFHIYDLKTLPR